MNNKEINLNDAKRYINYLLDNNRRLVEKGGHPIAIGLEAEAGVGKTSLLEQIAKERGMTYVRLNLAELDEPGDLTGFPIKEFYVRKDGKGGWVPNEALATYEAMGYKSTTKTRMSYATPAWLPEENPNGCLINLDDYSRASSVFLQATMELVNTGKYGPWKLPSNTSIVLTSNPDNGQYTVQSLDSAQKTRFINFKVSFDTDVWTVWAERAEIDNRAINFVVHNADLFEKKNSLNQKILNARSFTTFCNAISGIENWESKNDMKMIAGIAKGCFNDDNDAIGSLFISFVNNRLDRIIPPQKILYGDWDEVKKELISCVYNGEKPEPDRFRPEVSSIIATRIVNYSSYMFDKGKETKPIAQRIIDLIDSPVRILTEDNIFHVIKILYSGYKNRLNIMLVNPKINRIITTL